MIGVTRIFHSPFPSYPDTHRKKKSFSPLNIDLNIHLHINSFVTEPIPNLVTLPAES